jgi:glutaconate CoA-transferase subunit A
VSESDVLATARLDDATVGVGGFMFLNHPVALMRQLLRRSPTNLRVVFGPAAGPEVDIMIAAGAVREVVTSHVGAESLATICPVFRTEVERGTIRVWECDEAHWYLALWAQGHGVPYQVTNVGVGSSLPRLNPEIQPIRGPFDDTEQLAVKAIAIDIALIAADGVEPQTGSAVFDSFPYGDVVMAQAAEKLVIQGEREISLDWLKEQPERTLITHADETIVAPGGVRPFGRGVVEQPDWTELARLVSAGRRWRDGDKSAMHRYLDDFLATDLEFAASTGDPS